MKITLKPFFIVVMFVMTLTGAGPVRSENLQAETSVPASPPLSMTLNELMSRLEKRYEVPCFSVSFKQASTLQAMQITDTAEGKAFFKRPGMMRWEYNAPDNQQIITNGNILWIYRPEDNQVMIGDALSVFGDGKGASFLSDIGLIKNRFELSFEKSDNGDDYILRLMPKEEQQDVSVIYLLVSGKTFYVTQIETYNVYGDENRIELIDYNFGMNIPDSQFNFVPPENVDVLRLDQ